MWHSVFSKDVAPALTVSLAALCLAGAAAAQTKPASPSYEEIAARWAQDGVAREATELGLKMDVQMGVLDTRLRLAACGHVEPFLPLGSRLWGKSRVGLRCVDGVSRWSVTVPVSVKAVGNAWVVRNPVTVGSAIKADDLVEAEVDWAEYSVPVVRTQAEWIGHVATRNLQTGQTLRQGMTKPAQVFQAGAAVRVVAQGAGFMVTSEAQALSAGVVGQQARVRMESGRVTSGAVLDARTVKIEL